MYVSYTLLYRWFLYLVLFLRVSPSPFPPAAFVLYVRTTFLFVVVVHSVRTYLQCLYRLVCHMPLTLPCLQSAICMRGFVTRGEHCRVLSACCCACGCPDSILVDTAININIMHLYRKMGERREGGHNSLILTPDVPFDHKLRAWRVATAAAAACSTCYDSAVRITRACLVPGTFLQGCY